MSDKDTSVEVDAGDAGAIVTSATGGKVYHQPDLDGHDAPPPAAPASEPATPTTPPIDDGEAPRRGRPPKKLALVEPVAPPSAPPASPSPPPSRSAEDPRLAQARAIVAAARFTRRIDKRDATVETVEIRRRALTPLGMPGDVAAFAGDEALAELTQFCVDFLMGIGFLPTEDVYGDDDAS